MEAADDCGDALRAAAQPLHWRGHRAPGRGSRALARRATGSRALRSRPAAILCSRVRAAGVRRAAHAGARTRSGTGTSAGSGSDVATAVLAAAHPNLPVPHAHVA